MFSLMMLKTLIEPPHRGVFNERYRYVVRKNARKTSLYTINLLYIKVGVEWFIYFGVNIEDKT